MRKVRFVFHKARFEWRNIFIKSRKIRLVDDVISLWTWPLNPFTPRYSHMSVWIQDMYSDVHNAFDVRRFIGNNSGICYTSTMRGNENGTVSRPASGVFTNPKRWDYIELEVTDASFKVAKVWADVRVKKNIGYAIKTITRFFLPLWLVKKWKLDDPDREICSEHGEGWAVLLYAFNLEGSMTKRMLQYILIRSPRRLWRDLVRKHHVATYSLATGKMVRDENGKRVKT